MNRMKARSLQHLETLPAVPRRFFDEQIEGLITGARWISQALRRGNKPLTMGNGGRAADA